MPSLFQFATRFGACVELALIEGKTTELSEEADETVNSGETKRATSTEEHDTSKDSNGVARKGSDMIKFNWKKTRNEGAKLATKVQNSQRRCKTRNEGAINIL